MINLPLFWFCRHRKIRVRVVSLHQCMHVCMCLCACLRVRVYVCVCVCARVRAHVRLHASMLRPVNTSDAMVFT